MSNAKTKYDWDILTSGPCPKLEYRTPLEAKMHVQQHAPLKRGWTGKWRRVDHLDYLYIRSNSKGVEQKSFTIRLRATDEYI